MEGPLARGETEAFLSNHPGAGASKCALFQRGTSHGEEAMTSSRTRGLRNPAKATLITLLLLSGTGLRADGQCVTNEAPFQITNIQPATTGRTILTWAPTCTNFIFGVFSADDLLGTNALWVSRIGMWGDAGGTMSWTDTTANVRCRFYKAVRILPTTGSDWDSDNQPDAWEADYGLNPFDAGDAHTDLDNDGVDNLTEHLRGRDPTKSAVADPGGLVDLKVYTLLE